MTNAPMTRPLIMRAQYIKDLSFENPDPIAAFSSDDTEQPAISVNIQAKAQNLAENNFEVVLDVRVDAKRKEDVLFIAELSYGAVVSIEATKDMDPASLVMVDAPHLMFPFVRNIIADVIRDGGFPPLLLAPVDFAALFHQQQTQQAANA